METIEKLAFEEKIVKMLKTVFDPEIPVNVYDLGLIYNIDISDEAQAKIDMTLTAQLPCRRLHHRGYPYQARKHRRAEKH